MSFDVEFMPLALEDLGDKVQQLKNDNYRFIQILCVTTEDGIDIQYSFMKDGAIKNFTVKGVKKGTKVPSVTDKFLAAFVFENEGHDLFGVEFEGSLLDFKGKFYALSEKEPMNVISPQKKAAAEKAAQAAAKDAGGGAGPSAKDKLKDMDPEKAAKVKAAMEAKAAREAAKAAEKTTDAEKKEGE